jgi:two-component system sensor histidine kinase RegB
VAFVHFGLGIELPLGPLGITIAALAVWNLVDYRGIRKGRRVGHPEVALNLLVDVAAFTSVVYFSGGPATAGTLKMHRRTLQRKLAKRPAQD